MINILLVIGSFGIGGAENLAIDIACNLDKVRFRTVVCGLGTGGLKEKLKSAGIAYYDLNKKDGVNLSLIRSLARIIDQENISIVHTHGQGPLLYVCLSRLFSRRAKIIHSEHIDFTVESPSPRKMLFYNSILFRMIDTFVSISDHLNQCYAKLFPFLDNKILTVKNGIDVRKFSNYHVDNDLKSELGISSTKIIIGNIAVFREQKDHESLINAMPKVIASIPDAVLILAGDGPLRGRLEELVERLHLSSCIYFLGWRSDVSRLLNEFDLFVLPSLFEGLSLSLLEASAARVPIITTDVVGNNEFIQDGINGFLVPPRNSTVLAKKIVELLECPEKQAHFVDNGWKIVNEKYSQEKMIANYEMVYSSSI